MITRLVATLPILSSIASTDAFSASLQSRSLTFPTHRQTILYSEAADDTVDNNDTDGTSSSDSVEENPSAAPSGDGSDILSSPAFLKKKVEVLQSDVAALEKEIEEANAAYAAGKEEWGSKFDMLSKESQSMQERLAEIGARGTEQATVDVATNILTVLDNYDRAFQSVEAATNEEVEIVESYKHTYDMILDTFTELNVTKVETVGAEFDYEMHQAIMQMPSDEYEEGVVCQEFAMGWRCGDKLIRPAMVAVSGG